MSLRKLMLLATLCEILLRSKADDIIRLECLETDILIKDDCPVRQTRFSWLILNRGVIVKRKFAVFSSLLCEKPLQIKSL